MTTNIALNVAIVTVLFVANTNAIQRQSDTTKINNIFYINSKTNNSFYFLLSYCYNKNKIVVIKIQKRNKVDQLHTRVHRSTGTCIYICSQ